MKLKKLITDFPDTKKKMLRIFYRVFNRPKRSIRAIAKDSAITMCLKVITWKNY